MADDANTCCPECGAARTIVTACIAPETMHLCLACGSGFTAEHPATRRARPSGPLLTTASKAFRRLQRTGRRTVH